MSIEHEIHHLVSGRALEPVAVPVQRHLSGCHSVKHKILQFQQAVSLKSKEAGVSGKHFVCFVHAPTIADQG